MVNSCRSFERSQRPLGSRRLDCLALLHST